MSLGVLVRSIVFAVIGAGLASAQNIPFTLFATSNGISNIVPNNGTIGLTTAVGTQTQVVVKATYTGSSQAVFSTMPIQQGSTQFSIALTGTLPITLTPSQVLTFTVTYSATNANGATAQFSIPFTEGTGSMATSSAIQLSFVGTSPSFVLSYVLQTTNNTVQIPPGGTITFTPPTQINTTAQANFDISNLGSGTGIITNVQLTAGGPVFQLQGIPLFPSGGLPLASGMTLPLTVLYSPTAVGTDTGQITVTYQNGITAVVNLSGTGATSSYTYAVISAGKTTTVTPPGPIVVGSAAAPTAGSPAGTSSVLVQVTNKGNANGTINSINATAPFSVSGFPVNPPTLKPGDVENFTITYTPTQVGTQKGELLVGTDTFDLSGIGLGPALSFSYISNGVTISVVPPAAVIFSPVEVTKSEKVTFVVTNSGTSTATISNIGTATTSPFAITGPLTLPLTLLAGKSSQLTLTFTPVAVGFANGTLQVDNTQVPLLGSGTAPPPLPSYTFTGPTGNVAPLTQSGVTLTLAKSYPVDLTGVLTLTTSGDFGSDPAVQFSTGSRTVDFTISANTTSADFAGQGSQILLQTGTVAETVTLKPSFTTTGGVDLTPSSPTTLQFSVASAAPAIQSLAITNEGSASFTLLVIGYTTTRSLTTVNVTLHPASGYTLGTIPPVDVSQVASIWFQSAGSQSFGGQFEISIPFTITGPTPPTGKTLLQSIASVSATVSNSIGASNSLSANVQ